VPWLLPSVVQHVLLQVRGLGKLLVTQVTEMGPLATVDQHVRLQVSSLRNDLSQIWQVCGFSPLCLCHTMCGFSPLCLCHTMWIFSLAAGCSRWAAEALKRLHCYHHYPGLHLRCWNIFQITSSPDITRLEVIIKVIISNY